MRIFETLSEIFYSFVMNTRASDYQFFQNGHNYGNGMEYLFIALLLVPLCFCLYFYSDFTLIYAYLFFFFVANFGG